MSSNYRKWLYLVSLSLIWGSSFILIKKSLLGFNPLQMGALRIVISAIFIFIGGLHTIKNIKKEQWKWLIISGFLGTFFPAFLFAYAETEIDSAIASILNSLVPLNTILLGFAIFRIASTRRQIIGVVIGFMGTSILIIRGADLNPEQNYWYALLVVLSSLMYAANVNIIKRYLQEVRAVTIATGNFVAILIPAIIVLILNDFFTEETFDDPYFLSSLGYILILSAFGTALAKVLFNRLVQISTPVFASSVTYLMTIVAVGWGLLDGEEFTLIQAAATLLIFSGVYLANRKK